MTWEEARDAAGPGSVAILPVGAIEAHGPHLPLETDVIIAQAMARTGAARLAARGLRVLVLPPLTYTSAGFARGFAGHVRFNKLNLLTTNGKLLIMTSATAFSIIYPIPFIIQNLSCVT